MGQKIGVGGKLRSPKAQEFEKWGLKHSSLIEVYAYAVGL